jgi:hypothetical protein
MFHVIILSYWLELIDFFEATAIFDHLYNLGLKSMKFLVLTVFGVALKYNTNPIWESTNTREEFLKVNKDKIYIYKF